MLNLLSDRFHIEQGPTGGLFVVDGESEFDSEFVGSIKTGLALRDHRNGKHPRPRAACRACHEFPGMTLPMPHDPASGFGDPNLSLGA